MVFDLKANKTASSQCVEAKWNKAESGACYVKYEVFLINAAGSNICNETGYNIGEMMICNLPSDSKITHAQLIVSFKNAVKNVTANVTEVPITAPASTTASMTPTGNFSLALFPHLQISAKL